MRCLLGLLCFLCACGPGKEDPRFYHRGITTPTQAETPVRDLSNTSLLDLGQVSDLFELEAALALETTNQSIVGAVTDLVFHCDYWYILDQMTHQVYKFDERGKFIKAFGGKGAGPGEFEYPKQIKVCFDGLLGVSDPMKGTIQLFDHQGNYVDSSHPYMGDMAIFPRYAFSWQKKEALVIAAFGSLNPAAPEHVVLNATQKPHKVQFGFGSRIETIERAIAKGSATRAYTAFAEIAGHFWAGSPFTTHIDRFNSKGQLVARLGKQTKRDHRLLINEQDYADLHLERDPNQKMRKTLAAKAGNDNIGQIGNWVFVQMGPIFDVYQTDGTPVAVNLSAGRIWMNATHEDHLIMVFPSGFDLDELEEGVIKTHLIEANYQPEDNPYLLFFKLKTNLLHSQKTVRNGHQKQNASLSQQAVVPTSQTL